MTSRQEAGDKAILAAIERLGHVSVRHQGDWNAMGPTATTWRKLESAARRGVIHHERFEDRFNQEWSWFMIQLEGEPRPAVPTWAVRRLPSIARVAKAPA